MNTDDMTIEEIIAETAKLRKECLCMRSNTRKLNAMNYLYSKYLFKYTIDISRNPKCDIYYLYEKGNPYYIDKADFYNYKGAK